MPLGVLGEYAKSLFASPPCTLRFFPCTQLYGEVFGEVGRKGSIFTRVLHINLTQYLAYRFYRLPGFLAVRWFGSTPAPSPNPLSSQLGRPATHRKTKEERQLADGRGEEGGGCGAETYDHNKTWSSINHSNLSGFEKHLWLRQKRHSKPTSNFPQLIPVQKLINTSTFLIYLILFLLTCGNIVEDSGGKPQLLAAGLWVVVTVPASHHDPLPSHNSYSTQRGQVVISAHVSWERGLLWQ